MGVPAFYLLSLLSLFALTAPARADDALTVAKAMREAPIHDVFTDDGHIREGGRVVYDRYLMKVKTQAESK